MGKPVIVVLEEKQSDKGPYYKIINKGFESTQKATEWLIEEIRGSRLALEHSYYVGSFSTCLRGVKKIEIEEQPLMAEDPTPPTKKEEITPEVWQEHTDMLVDLISKLPDIPSVVPTKAEKPFDRAKFLTGAQDTSEERVSLGTDTIPVDLKW